MFSLSTNRWSPTSKDGNKTTFVLGIRMYICNLNVKPQRDRGNFFTCGQRPQVTVGHARGGGLQQVLQCGQRCCVHATQQIWIVLGHSV